MNRCFVIAEAGVNHNGSLATAKAMVDVAKSAGADAVKFQTFKAELLATPTAAKADYQQAGTQADQSQFEMLRALELSDKEFAELSEYCDEQDIEFLSTPFDEQSADMLNGLGMSRFKIPSGEATNFRLIKHIASFGKPIILSTGMCTMKEVERALIWVREVDPFLPVWLLQCVSNYPAEAKDTNLRAMQTMREAFDVPVGLSDHTLGYAVALGSVALGAVALEKHFTLDRSQAGPDHTASLEPQDLAGMIEGIREIESALGTGIKAPTPEELKVAAVARRSIVSARDLHAGTVLEDGDLGFLRPGAGIEPARYAELVGRTLATDVAKNTTLDWSMLR